MGAAEGAAAGVAADEAAAAERETAAGLAEAGAAGALAGAVDEAVEAAPVATGEAVEDTRPRVRIAGLAAPSAGLGAAARMALGGLSPGIGLSTGICRQPRGRRLRAGAVGTHTLPLLDSTHPQHII